MSAPKVILSGTDLTRSFGEGEARTAALRGVSLDMHAGELAVLIGASGSGKSTLLAVLSSLLRPDGGEVMALGQSLWRMTDHERERFRQANCGFVFQGFNLFPALSAWDHLEMILRWGTRMTGREIRTRVQEMLDLLGMSRKANLLPRDLSGGEKQRVAIGRALIKRPTFCFADEPTSALDWEHGRQVVELLRAAAHDELAAVILVTHDPRILPYADRVFRLDDGCLVEEGALVVAPAGEAP